MKKAVLLNIFLFIFSNIVAQNKISLTLKDGSVINGIGRIKADEQILFRKSEDAEKEIYNYKNVKKMTMYIDSDGSEQNYVYKIIEGSGGVGSVKLLEIIITGKINLYQDFSSGMTYVPNMSGSGYGFSNYSKTTYYISKTGSDTVTNLRIGNTYSNRFKKIAENYFKSCPELLEKINNKYFKRYGIGSVIKYYNQNCGN